MYLKITQVSQENTCVGVFINKVAGQKDRNFNKKDTPTQVFSFEICEIFNNTFFYRTAPMAASEEVSGFFCLIFSLAVFPFLWHRFSNFWKEIRKGRCSGPFCIRFDHFVFVITLWHALNHSYLATTTAHIHSKTCESFKFLHVF